MILNASSKKAQNELKTFFHRDIFTRAYSLSLSRVLSLFKKRKPGSDKQLYRGSCIEWRSSFFCDRLLVPESFFDG